jgi:anti-sigma regulatory factor (Ser/Thr protein kinase)
LLEGSRCIPGEESDVELALREALANAAVHGNQKGQIKVHTCAVVADRCNEISIVVTDQGKGLDFINIAGGLTPEATGECANSIQLMKAYLDEVYFERGGSEIHMRKCARIGLH